LYQQRNAPMLSGEVMDWTHKGLAIFAAAASGLYVLWQWARLHGEASRNKGFGAHLTQVTRIEQRAQEIERDWPFAVAELLALREQLCRVKTEALEELANGELAGRELLPGFLIAVNDARDYVNRLLPPQGATASRLLE
jgi:hypothetical protein